MPQHAQRLLLVFRTASRLGELVIGSPKHLRPEYISIVRPMRLLFGATPIWKNDVSMLFRCMRTLTGTPGIRHLQCSASSEDPYRQSITLQSRCFVASLFTQLSSFLEVFISLDHQKMSGGSRQPRKGCRGLIRLVVINARIVGIAFRVTWPISVHMHPSSLPLTNLAYRSLRPPHHLALPSIFVGMTRPTAQASSPHPLFPSLPSPLPFLFSV